MMSPNIVRANRRCVFDLRMSPMILDTLHTIGDRLAEYFYVTHSCILLK